MTDKKPALPSKFIIYGAFALGLSTAIAVRALIVLDHLHPGWVRPVWYFAVLGNFVFFFYRYRVTEKRKRAINRHHLLDKLAASNPLSDDDRAVLIYLLTSLKKSPENLNYLIIVAFSIVAIAIDLFFVYL